MGAENNWTWPPSMDAVVAAPESHRVLLENEDVRVLEVTIPAGHREPEHTHRAHSVMIVDGPAQIRYYKGDVPGSPGGPVAHLAHPAATTPVTAVSGLRETALAYRAGVMPRRRRKWRLR